MLKRFVPAPFRVAMTAVLAGMVLFTLVRLAFFLAYRQGFAGLPAGEILEAFLLGLRFDLNVLAVLMGLFFLVLHIPGGWKGFPLLTAPLLWVPLPLLILAVALLLVDLNFYGDTGRHLSYEIFSLGNDLGATFIMGLHYRWTILAFLLLVPVLPWGWNRLLLRVWDGGEKRSLPAETAWLAAYLILFFLAARGGLQSKPIRTSYAFTQGRMELGHLALNGAFTVGQTLAEGNTSVPRFLDEEEARKRLRGLLTVPGTRFLDEAYPVFRTDGPSPAAVSGPKPNIVLLVMESWTGAFTGALGGREGITPRFDGLAKEGLLAPEFYAVGRRSSDAIGSICLGVPSFPDSHVLAGSLEQNSYRGLGRLLGEAGYSSFFMHGARVGSFGFNGFAGVAGFQRYIGMEDVDPAPGDRDDTWGVWDHVMLGRLRKELGGMKEPFLALFFSLSSHTPFQLPPDEPRTSGPGDPDGEFFDTLRYSDKALGEFLDQARKEPWFKDTVFLIVGDHTSGKALMGTRDRHRVPLLVWAPGRVKPGIIPGPGGQLDLLPTILDLAGVKAPHHSLGRSLLRPNHHTAFLNLGDGYGWVTRGLLLVTGLAGENPILTPLEAPALPEEGADSLRKELLSFVQVTKGLVRDNRLAPR